jgi:hypothetical protein
MHHIPPVVLCCVALRCFCCACSRFELNTGTLLKQEKKSVRQVLSRNVLSKANEYFIGIKHGLAIAFPHFLFHPPYDASLRIVSLMPLDNHC